MSHVIVAGYDGTPSSKAAVDLAVLLAEPNDARVITVTGYETPFPSLGHGGSIATDAVRTERARHEASAILTDIRAPNVERVTQPGTPARALCTVAELEDADLIVVGTTHRGRLGRIVPGSTAEQLLQGSPCAIAVAPAEQLGRGIRVVAVAYDRQAESLEALRAAQELARDHDAELRILAVDEPPRTAMDEAVLVAHDEERARLRDDVAAVTERLSASLRVSGQVLTGRAADALVAACQDDVDLLVAGSRCYGPLRAALTGSVSRQLVERADCPVLIVPRGVPARRDGAAGPQTIADATAK